MAMAIGGRAPDGSNLRQRCAPMENLMWLSISLPAMVRFFKSPCPDTLSPVNRTGYSTATLGLDLGCIPFILPSLVTSRIHPSRRRSVRRLKKTQLEFFRTGKRNGIRINQWFLEPFWASRGGGVGSVRKLQCNQQPLFRGESPGFVNLLLCQHVAKLTWTPRSTQTGKRGCGFRFHNAILHGNGMPVTIQNDDLTRIIHERFCCNRQCLGERRGARG